MNSRKILVITAFLAITSAQSAARADEFLIRETESLRNSLSMTDASRLPLTLRLADLCMEDAASAESGLPGAAAAPVGLLASSAGCVRVAANQTQALLLLRVAERDAVGVQACGGREPRHQARWSCH